MYGRKTVYCSAHVHVVTLPLRIIVRQMRLQLIGEGEGICSLYQTYQISHREKNPAFKVNENYFQTIKINSKQFLIDKFTRCLVIQVTFNLKCNTKSIDRPCF